jgi:hypothetical protein
MMKLLLFQLHLLKSNSSPIIVQTLYFPYLNFTPIAHLQYKQYFLIIQAVGPEWRITTYMRTSKVRMMCNKANCLKIYTPCSS